VAATTLSRLKPLRPLVMRVLRWLGGVVGGVLTVAALFGISGWIGSSIPRNSGWVEPEDGITIMVETNGTHTGIVVPVVTPEKDWRTVFPSAGMPRKDRQYATHLAIGWGEREVFLAVPTWGDLKASTALRIATVGGDSVIRVSRYVRPAASEDFRPVRLTPAQYARLVAAIDEKLAPVQKNEARAELRGTYGSDSYYEARGTYTMISNCNSWVGDVLAKAGIEMGRWTPFAGGVMKWIAVPDDPIR